MGSVWEAQDQSLRRTVAIKLIQLAGHADSTSEARFRREAQAAAGLAHPNVVTVHDFGVDNGIAFMVMECLPGPDLGALVRSAGPLPVDRALELLEQAAAGLAAAHARGILHRDVKPANLMLSGQDTLKVLDFGIASVAERSEQLTAANQVIGTLAYLAPERSMGSPASVASDLYALGCVAMTLLTGAPPFEGTTGQILMKHLNEAPPRLTDRRPDLPVGLNDLVSALLAKDPAQRPRSATETVGQVLQFRQALASGHSASAAVHGTRPGQPRTGNDAEETIDRTVIRPGVAPAAGAAPGEVVQGGASDPARPGGLVASFSDRRSVSQGTAVMADQQFRVLTRQLVSVMAGSHPDTTGPLKAIQSSVDDGVYSIDLAVAEAKTAYLSKGLGGGLFPGGSGRLPVIDHKRQLAFPEWIDQADRFRRAMQTIARPLWPGERREFQDHAQMWMSEILSSVDAAKADLLSTAQQHWSETQTRAADDWRRFLVARANDIASGLPLDARAYRAAVPSWVAMTRARPEPLRPMGSLGQVVLRGFTMPLPFHPPSTADLSATTSFGPLVWTSPDQGVFQQPLLWDWDADGGFATDDPRIVQTALLDMLELLPAGALRIDAVDPQRLGRSIDYLYGLGEQTGQVIGDAVWTTPEQVAKVLVTLEQHVTYVTQKYLQGQHKSLSQYNAAAGEVAEPYRLLAVHDFPAGFTRDGQHIDQESVLRLARLAQVGRRAGVFVVVTTRTRRPELPMPWLAHGVIDRDHGAWRRVAEVSQAAARMGVVPNWVFEAFPVPSSAQLAAMHAAIQRGFVTAAATDVTPDRVAQLAQGEVDAAAAKGLRGPEVVAHPGEPSGTWWRGHTSERAVARFGRAGSSAVASLMLDGLDSSSALLGGRTGSGKSVLLHALIGAWCMAYSPEELELYLVDLKEGVEFKPYAENLLPHARVIAVASNREFAMSVLESVDAEIQQRGELFRATGGSAVNLQTYRGRTGRVLSRVVLVVDEFQVLFVSDDQLSRRAHELLERIVKQGRAFGVHAVLASQSLSGSASAIKNLVGQIPNRIVMACSDGDSRLLLGEENPDAQYLSKPGEGLLNPKSGLREANQRFQCAFWDVPQRTRMAQQARRMADATGFARHPAVFEGYAAASVSDVRQDQLWPGEPTRKLPLPLGMPMSLEGPVVAQLNRAAGGNLLVMAQDPAPLLAVALAGLPGRGVEVELVDFTADDLAWEAAIAQLTRFGVRNHVRRRGTVARVLDELLAEVEARHAREAFTDPARLLVLSGVQRARELDPDDYSEEAALDQLRRLLRDGPEVGVHVLVCIDRLASFDRRLGRQLLPEFSLRALGPMAEGDSMMLIDSPAASSLRDSQLVVDDYDRGTTVVVRRFQTPDPDWPSGLKDR